MKYRPTALSVIALLLLSSTYSQGLFEQALTSQDSIENRREVLHGYARSVCYIGVSELDETEMQSIFAEGAFSIERIIGAEGKLFTEFRLRSGNEFGEDFSEITLREAWVSNYFGPLNVQYGKQIIRWGSSSFINPTDQFTAMNPTVRSPEADDRYLSTWAVNAALQITNSSVLKIHWIPVHRTSVLLTRPFAFPEYIHFKNEGRPDILVKNSGIGLLYDLRSSMLDLQLSFYHGYRNSPAVFADTAIFDMSTFTPQLIELSKRAYPINAYGLNFTIPAGSYLFRAEACWMDLPEESIADSILHPEISYCAEIEQVGEFVNLIGGYYGKYLPEYTPIEMEADALTKGFPDPADLFPPGFVPDASFPISYLNSQLRGFNRLYAYQVEEFYHSCYGIARIQLFHQLLDIEIAGMYAFTNKEITLSGSLKFNITDGLNIQLGGYLLRGPEGSLYDLVGSELSAFYISAKAIF